MRIQSSKVLSAQMQALGALPQTMAFSEVYQALQTGVVDGTENPPSNMYTQKMHEVQKHAIVTNHGYLGYAVIVNKKFWDGLPADVRAGLEAAMAEATKYANTIAKQENDQALEKVKASGKTQVYVPTAAEQAAWKKALVRVHKEMESRIGKETIQSVLQRDRVQGRLTAVTPACPRPSHAGGRLQQPGVPQRRRTGRRPEAWSIASSITSRSGSSRSSSARRR